MRIATAGFIFGKGDRYAYPGVSVKKRLHTYSSVLTAVEINQTYYRGLTLATAKRWVSTTPKNFKFILKAHRSIVNSSDPKKIKAHWTTFWRSTKPLKDKLGGVLFEFSERFTYTNLNYIKLKALARSTKACKRRIIEFRHKSWLTPKVLKKIERLGFKVASTHANRWLWSKITPPIRKGFLYIRLHGTRDKYEGRYSATFLRKLGRRMRGRNGYVVFNNTSWSTLGVDAYSDAKKLMALTQG